MNVVCPSCKTKYAVDDSRIPPAGVTIKCPKCSHTFVAKKAPPPESPASSVEPEPGIVSLPGSRATSAIGLPGAQAASPPSQSRESGVRDDLDLGLDLGLELPPAPDLGARSKAQHPPSAAPGASLPSGAPHAGPGTLDFVDETARKAGLPTSSRSRTEYRVRSRTGGTRGPFGEQRIVAMIQSGELTGNEDISEDGLAWRAMTSHPDLNRAINATKSASDVMSFGEVDLGVGDESAPIGPSITPSRGPAGAPQAGPLRGGVASPSGMPGGVAGTAAFGPAPEGAPPVELSETDNQGTKSKTSDLRVAEVPDLPPIWKTYRKPIIAFAVVVGFVLVGVFTHLTSYGAYGYKHVAEWMKPPPPPPPEKPPPPPPKTVNPKEIAALIDEASYEGFRSVIATVKQAGEALPDNLLAGAKARGFATLYYGEAHFPIADLQSAVDKLGSLDVSSALGGNAAAAKLEMQKARAALAIAKKEQASVLSELDVAVAQQSADKELALLLGLARLASGDLKGAMEAFDKALVVSASYAPALFAMGSAVEKAGEKDAEIDAAEWYRRAAEAGPAHARAGIAASGLFRRNHMHGEERRVLTLTAEHADRGLPPDERAAFLHRAAQSLDAAGQTARAMAFAVEASRLDPANVEYVAMAAAALAAAGKIPEAVDTLGPVLKRNPSEVSALVARARAHMAGGDIAKAYVDLEAAEKLRPGNAELLVLEASFHEKLGKYTDARAVLERAAKSATGPSVQTALGRIHLRTGAVDAAFGAATAAVAADAYSADAHVLLGECLLLRGQRDKALESFETALRLDDESMGARLGYANTLRDMTEAERKEAKVADISPIPIYLALLREHPSDPTLMFEYGRALELQGDVDTALELYREASRLNEKDVRPHLKVVQAYLERKSPDVPSAKKSLEVAERIEVSSGTQQPEVRYWVARVAYLEKRFSDATSAMRTACDLSPKNAMYHLWMGKILEANNSLYEAIQAYERAVELNSRLAPAWRALGWSSLERHAFDAAREHFTRYHEVNPGDPSIYVDIGLSFTRQNKDDEAMEAFMKAIESAPRDSQALLQIGNILARRGQDAKALGYFEKAARADPEHGEAWCQWGIALSRGKLKKEGRTALERCLKLENAPDDMKQNAQQILGEI